MYGWMDYTWQTVERSATIPQQCLDARQRCITLICKETYPRLYSSPQGLNIWNFYNTHGIEQISGLCNPDTSHLAAPAQLAPVVEPPGEHLSSVCDGQRVVAPHRNLHHILALRREVACRAGASTHVREQGVLRVRALCTSRQTLRMHVHQSWHTPVENKGARRATAHGNAITSHL
jgi:hypothetical protein